MLVLYHTLFCFSTDFLFFLRLSVFWTVGLIFVPKRVGEGERIFGGSCIEDAEDLVKCHKKR